MVDYIRTLVLTIGALVVFFIPVLAPEIFIALAVIAWPLIYLLIWLASFGHDLVNDLPWVVFNPDRVFWFPILMILLFVLPVFEFNRTVAMIVTWVPMVLLPGFMILVGVAIEYEDGWQKYVIDKYTNDDCRNVAINGCYYQPKAGNNIPSFITEYRDIDSVKEVISK